MKIKLFTIPNMLTLGNLLCGSLAVVSALSFNNLTWSFWLIVLAVVFDFFDGFVARLLKCPSLIGVQLDSLADMVSSGVAPASIAYVLFTNAALFEQPAIRFGGGVLCMLIALFSALRLAKFNIDDTQHTEFCGMPTPANALFFGSLGWISANTDFAIGSWILAFVVLMSWLLISPIRMFAFKFQGYGWAGNELRYTFLAVSAVLLALLGVQALPVVILLYVLTSGVRWALIRKQ